MSEDATKPRIAILGGAGKEGGGLALRWAAAGYQVVLGSRDPVRSQPAVDELNALLPEPRLRCLDNADAAREGDIVVLTVPYAAQQSAALAVRDALKGKVLIDVTVPLVPPKVSLVQLPAGGSAVAALQVALGPEVKVVSAFQNISAHLLKDLQRPVDCDVLVCGDDAGAVDLVIQLAEAAGMRAWAAGPLANSVVAEGLTSVLIAINRRYKSPESGIRITGAHGP